MSGSLQSTTGIRSIEGKLFIQTFNREDTICFDERLC
jgi:hypothetical protein